ncbi:NDP-sugar pyrophosphorylase [Abditibacterium utsteinense]|uniref:NDP-sugar pyrophosphorylase n=1 Tax=Abditibacterium utsteinense TaxID=1960156 RepID=A0A2S8SVU7_9BACT|nr:sugar phosphate nucleotidyltransferase [Abditibacterium utsteinense]PQV64912.1 NDP-sugar pyrophosphorylase [Abditibacterium utsteinense]
MQAIILAGGMGTRLRPLTYTVPKPMLPIGGRPALAHLVESLAKAGCDEVIITTNYLAELIDAKLSMLNLPIPVHCVKEDQPLGTAGCIRNLYSRLQDEFIVVQGDSVSDIDFGAFLKFHQEKNADVSISTIRVADTREFGILLTDETGRITRFQEKPRPEEAFSNTANAGFYILKKAMFADVPDGVPYDFARQLFPKLMEQGARFYGYEMRGYWVDIGRVGNYIEGNLHQIRGKAIVAPDVNIPEDTTLISPYIIGAGTKIGSRCTIGPGVVLGARCSVGDGSHLSKAVIYDDVTIGPRGRLTDCVVAARSRLGKEVTIESHAVVGEACDIGAGVEVAAHSRVGPITPVAAGTSVEGVVAPRLQKLHGLQRIVVSGPVMEKLMPDEREVYALLAEYGEMTARGIAEAGTLPLLRVMTVLHALEKSELALSTLDYPRRYALTREEQILPRRLLIVDDSDDSRELLRIVFGSQGHSMRLVRDGIEAVEAVREERFDAIIMDLEMPQLNGWDATRLIRSMPNGRTAPVIIYTAYPTDDMSAKMLDVGANDVLSKTILPDEMLAHVMQFLKK